MPAWKAKRLADVRTLSASSAVSPSPVAVDAFKTPLIVDSRFGDVQSAGLRHRRARESFWSATRTTTTTDTSTSTQRTTRRVTRSGSPSTGFIRESRC